MKNKTLNFTQQEKNTLKEIGGLSGAISSLIVGKAQGLEDDEMADNIFNGQRLGKNAVENNLVYIVSRNLNSYISKKLNNGKHSYLIIEPDNPEDFTEEKILEKNLDLDKFKMIDIGGGKKGLINGGYNDENAENNFDNKNHLITIINQETDLKLTSNIYNNILDNDYNPEIRIVKPSNGLSDTEFIYNILQNIDNYIQNTEINPIEYLLFKQNCNTYSNSLLDYSGADKNRNNNMKGIDPGKNNRIDINYYR